MPFGPSLSSTPEQKESWNIRNAHEDSLAVYTCDPKFASQVARPKDPPVLKNATESAIRDQKTGSLRKGSFHWRNL